MKAKIFYRIYVGALLVILGWCVLGYSQGTNGTNTVTAQVASDKPVEAVSVVVKENPTSLSFGLDKVEALQGKVMDIPLWQYIATVIFVGLAFLAARIFDWLVAVQLKKVVAKTKWKLDDLIVQLLRGPVKMLALVIFLQVGLNVFQWPDWLENWLKKGFYLLVAASLTYMALKLVDLGATYWKKYPGVKADKTFNDLLIPLLSKSVKAFVLIMAVLVTLDNIGFNVRTLLAGVSISGLALGLAAQDTVGNLFGAAAVFIDKPFKIGDRVQLDGIDGTVEEIGLRSTRVRNLDGFLVTVPNKTMGNATITNVTRRPHFKTVMNIGVTYDTPAQKVAEAVAILKEVYGKHPMTGDLIVGFNNFADSALNILVVHFWKELDFKVHVAGMQEMHLEVKRRFDEAGISFAFPSRTVYLRQDNEWRVQVPPAEGKEAA